MKPEFVPVDDTHIWMLWDLLLERLREPNTNISHKDLPNYNDHVAFVKTNPYHKWYMINVDGDIVGAIYVTWDNEVGINLFRSHRGKGIGDAALAKLLREETPLPAIAGKRPGHFVANINPANWPSIWLFEKHGFKHVQNTYARIFPKP